MAGGSFRAPFLTLSWPTGEFGGMGLEGAVRLAYKKELLSITDPKEREKEEKRLIDEMYQKGKAVNMAAYLEIDQVIDPAETRRWVVRGWKSCPRPGKRVGKKRPMVDTW
ncbi:hypothetical protein HK104_010544 [Borealophlyctis nickersoniae]|nr:hypothetical protein HK104_010544 [Borealophlyctis nickersoniae]